MLTTEDLTQESIGCLSHFDNFNNKDTANEIERLDILKLRIIY